MRRLAANVRSRAARPGGSGAGAWRRCNNAPGALRQGLASGSRCWRKRRNPAQPSSPTPSGVRSRRPQGRFFSAAMTTASASIQPEVAHADDEHQQHQRPAAADAEDAMIDAQPPRLAQRRPAVPARSDEGERRVALLEAAVLERAELEQPRRPPARPRRAPSRRRPATGTAGRGEMQQRVQRVRDEAEGEPRGEEAGNHQRGQPRRHPDVRATMRRKIASIGRRRRQHHRRDHQHPRAGVEQRRHDDVALRHRAAQRRQRAGVRPARRARGSGRRDSRSTARAQPRPARTARRAAPRAAASDPRRPAPRRRRRRPPWQFPSSRERATNQYLHRRLSLRKRALPSQPRSGGDQRASCLYRTKGARPPEAFRADCLRVKTRAF